MPVSEKHLHAIADGKLKHSLVTVLAKWHDSRYYLCKVLKVLPGRALVKFEDHVESWMNREDLHCQLNIDLIPESKIVCCHCDAGCTDPPNEIYICETCQQGYHVECEGIDRKLYDSDDDDWTCNTCQAICNNALPIRQAPAVAMPIDLQAPRRELHGKSVDLSDTSHESDDTMTDDEVTRPYRPQPPPVSDKPNINLTPQPSPMAEDFQEMDMDIDEPAANVEVPAAIEYPQPARPTKKSPEIPTAAMMNIILDNKDNKKRHIKFKTVAKRSRKQKAPCRAA